METGQGTMSGLRASFSALGAQAFIRVAVEARRRAVWYIDAIVAPPSDPPGWQPQVWEYADVTFIAAQVPAAALAAALDPADAQVLPLGGYRLTLPVLSDQVQWQHKPSSRPV